MRVAAIQLTAGPDPAANRAAAVEAIRAAASRGATLIVLPEKWLALGAAPVLAPVAEPLTGPLVTELRALAAELGIDLLAGSISEQPTAGDARLFNSALHLRPDGSIGARYRKIHLFDADIEGRRYRESDAEQPGDTAVASPLGTADALLGLAICFDLRFPALFNRLADAGADVIALPSAFTEATTRAHWETLVRSRAIETGCFVIAANQVGEHADGARSGGDSMIVDPWGRILARAGTDAPEIIITELDLAEIDRARQMVPTLQLMRPGAYARPVRIGDASIPEAQTTGPAASA